MKSGGERDDREGRLTDQSRQFALKTRNAVCIADDRPHNYAKVAIIVCHGMGQQVRFQTIGDLVASLRRLHCVNSDVVARLVKFSEKLILGRAELRLAPERNAAADEESSAMPNAPCPGTDVHIYEAYWAPLTEGRVTLRDVVLFLLRAGLSGLKSASRGSFTRFMFNEPQTFPQKRWLFLIFAWALAVVGALVALDVATVVMAPSVKFIPGARWADKPWLRPALVSDVLLFFSALLFFAIGAIVSRLSAVFGKLRPQARVASRLSALPTYMMFGLITVAGALAATHLTYAILSKEPAVWSILEWPTWLAAPVQARTALLWVPMLIISFVARRFLVSFLGDVAAYVSSYRLNKFDEIREAIKKTVFEAVCAVYRDGGYGSCVLVGHSLGSVVAYDALNALLVEREATGTQFPRTAGLITFGSPLDKTAFVFRTHSPKECDIREGLAAAVQPLIVDGTQRPPWVNIWSPQDIISGPLDLYDRSDRKNSQPICNLTDWDAKTPLLAHVEYWNNPLLASAIVRAVSADTPITV